MMKLLWPVSIALGAIYAADTATSDRASEPGRPDAVRATADPSHDRGAATQTTKPVDATGADQIDELALSDEVANVLASIAATSKPATPQIDSIQPIPMSQSKAEVAKRLQNAKARLLRARKAAANAASTPAKLEQARLELVAAQQELAVAHALASCCGSVVHANCPPMKDCLKQDACLTVQLPPLEFSAPTFTRQGAHTFISVFNAAAARGVENATIRAMNATQACPSCVPKQPDPPCDPR